MSARRRLLILLWALGAASHAAFASDAGSTAFNFLKLEVGARQSAMGGGGVALADDANAARHNPGGAAFFENPEAGFLLTSYQQDVSYGHAALALPTPAGAFGLQLTRLSYGSVSGYDPNNNAINVQDSGDTAAGFSYARRIADRWGLGGTVRYLHERLDDLTATGTSFDFGAAYHVASNDPLWSKIRLGASLENVGPSVRFVDQHASLPRQSVVGVGLDQFHHVTVQMEIHMPSGVSPYLTVGGEYDWAQRFLLRAGYRSGVTTGSGLSVGAGLRLKSVQFDLAWTPYSALEDVIQAGVLIRFSNPFSSATAATTPAAASTQPSAPGVLSVPLEHKP